MGGLEENRIKNADLGAFVRDGRESRGLTYFDAAEMSDLDHTYWRKLEAGLYATPNPKTLERVAAVIQCPVETLYELSGYKLSEELPTLKPYLRAKYNLPPDAVAQLESYFSFLRNQYGIPQD